VTEDQREQWRKALAAGAAAGRRRSYRPRARGVQAVKGAGMVRVMPPSRLARGDLCTLVSVSEPVQELPADSPAVSAAVARARRGVVTHLTVGGKRVAAIVPESMLDALRAAEGAEDAAEADAAMDEPGESIPLEDLEAEFGH